MIRFLLLFQAERIKWLRNWATALVILAPVSQVLFLFIFYWFLEDRANPIGPGFIAWYQVNGNGWNLFFMPITTALVAAISWDIEEMSKDRKHLFVQPCSCYAHYAVKLASHFSLILLSQTLFFSLLTAGGIALRHYVPTLDMGDVHSQFLLRLAGTSFIASLPLVALHTWVSSRFNGLLTSLVVAVTGTWATSQLPDKLFLIQLSPWGMATQSVAISGGSTGGVRGLLVGALLCSALLAALGTMDFHWRGKSFT